MQFYFIVFLGSGHWIHLVRIKPKEKGKNEKGRFVGFFLFLVFSFQSREEFWANLIPMVSKLFWMKADLPAKSLGCNIDQIKELVKQLVGGRVKGRRRVSHRFLPQWITGVRALSSTAVKGTLTVPVLPQLHSRPCEPERFLIMSFQCVPQNLSQREKKRSVYFTKACCQHRSVSFFF